MAVLFNIIQRRPSWVVEVDGTEVSGVLGCEWAHGFDRRVAEASFTLTRLPSWVGAWGTVTISAGATPATHRTRFTGIIHPQFKYKGGPREVTVACRGKLYHAARALVSAETTDADVPGLDLSNRNQRAQITAVLDANGLAGQYTPARIGTTDHIFGTQLSVKAKGSSNPNVWKRDTSGMSFIEARDKVGLGHRLVEDVDPATGFTTITRPMIAPRPGPTAAITLSEGVDFSVDGASAEHDDGDEVYNRVIVIGYSDGTKPVKAEETAGHPHPEPGVPVVTAPPYQSNLIEQAEPGDHAKGLSCREVAQWQIREVCQVQLRVELETPRDEFFPLATSLGIYAPDRLEVAQTMWLRSVQGSAGNGKGFSQRLSLRAPAAPGRGGILIPQEQFVYSPGAIAYGIGAPWRAA